MKKAIYDKSGNKMVNLNTGHREFDRQTSGIMDGQVWGDTQHSACIRPWEFRVMPDGKTICPEGQLFNFDMKYFRESGMPDYVVNRVRELARKDFETGHKYPSTGNPDGVLVYQFHHWYMPARDWRGWRPDRKQKYVHGWVVTSGALDGHRHLATFVDGFYRYRSERILDVCAEYICNSPEEADIVGARYRESYAQHAQKGRAA